MVVPDPGRELQGLISWEYRPHGPKDAMVTLAGVSKTIPAFPCFNSALTRGPFEKLMKQMGMDPVTSLQ